MFQARTGSGRMSSQALFAGFGLALVAAIALSMALRRGTPAPEEPQAVALPVRPPEAASGGSVPTPPLPGPDVKGPSSKPPPRKPSGDEFGSDDSGARHVVPTATELDAIVRDRKASRKRQIEALRLSYQDRVDPSLKTFASILAEPDFEVELRVAAIGILSKGCAADAKARGLLLAFADSHGSSDPGRDLALCAVLRCGSDEELSRCSDLVFREQNAESVASAARGLAANPSAAARALLLDVCARHPDPEARRRAEEERTGAHSPGSPGRPDPESEEQ